MTNTSHAYIFHVTKDGRSQTKASQGHASQLSWYRAHLKDNGFQVDAQHLADERCSLCK